MSNASRRRVRQRLAEIHLREGDGMSRPWFDNLANKDIKSRPKERPQGQAMQTEMGDAADYVQEGNFDDACAAAGKTAELKQACANAKAK